MSAAKLTHEAILEKLCNELLYNSSGLPLTFTIRLMRSGFYVHDHTQLSKMIAYLYLFNNNFYYNNNDLQNLYQTVIDQVGVSLCVLFLITHSILVKLKPNKIL